MSQNKVILQLRSLTLNHESSLKPDVKEAILSTILGTPDGIRYRLLDSEKKLSEIPDMSFFTLRKDEDLIFILAFCERITHFNKASLNTNYVRYVSFNPSLARKSGSKKTSEQSMQRIGNSIIKEGMKKFAETFPFTILDKNADATKKIFYGYVEESNTRSLDLTKFFFERIRTLSVRSYSNLFPKHYPEVEKVSPPNLEPVINKIKDTYKNHTLFFLDKECIHKNYYIYKENGEIIAGLKAEIVNWKIEQLPGIFGKVLKNILPYIPILSRIISKEKFSFLSIDTIFCKDKREDVLPKLFASACSIQKTYAALIYSDSEEAVNLQLSKLKNMGLLNKMQKPATVAIVAGFVNYSEDEKIPFKNNPVYISGYDLT